MSGLSARQRAHVVRKIRGELELYGGLPSLHKRHLARTVDRLAELYGVPTKEVRAIWSDHLVRRRKAVFEFQREAFLARVARGEDCATSGVLTLEQMNVHYGAVERC